MHAIKVATAAKRLGLSKVSVHNWVKRLELVENGHARFDNGVVFLTSEALTIIENAHKQHNPTSTRNTRQVAEKAAVKLAEASREVYEKLFDQFTDRFDQEVRFLRQELTRRDETIQNMLTKQAEERQRTDSIIMKMTHDLEGTRKAALAIEAKVTALAEKTEMSAQFELMNTPPEPVQAWQPRSVTSDPVRDLPWYQRAWIKFAYPERLRQRLEN